MIWSKQNQDSFFVSLKEKLKDIKADFRLDQISYLKIGGRAKYFFEAKNKSDLIKAVLLARKLNLPHLVVGNCSNILFLDSGFLGLIIKNNYMRLNGGAIQILENEVTAPSGMPLLSLVKEAGWKNLGGIEFLATIPGTVGGAVVNSAEAFSKKIKDYLISVNVLNEQGQEEFIKTEKLGLKYRGSIFKGKAKQSQYLNYPLILEAKFSLKKRSIQEVERLIQSLALIRAKSQPREPSLGCIFKNPAYRQAGPICPKREDLQKISKNNRISAGFLIDQAGLKGKRKGKIKISNLHANFFLNLDKGKSKDYLDLIMEAKEKVREKFDIMLEEEIEIIDNSNFKSPAYRQAGKIQNDNSKSKIK